MGSGRFKDYEFESFEICGTKSFIKDDDAAYLSYLFNNQMYDELFQFCLIKHYLVLFDNDVLKISHSSEWELLM